MKLKVFGEEIRVLKEKGLLEKGMRAYYIPDKKMISIDATLVGKDYFSSLVHELVHVVWRRTGLDQTQIPMQVEEIICENVAIAMIENFEIRFKSKKK